MRSARIVVTDTASAGVVAVAATASTSARAPFAEAAAAVELFAGVQEGNEVGGQAEVGRRLVFTGCAVGRLQSTPHSRADDEPKDTMRCVGELSMKIAVTGTTGFLGRYVVRLLATAGHQLRCWYRSESDRSGFDGLADAIEWLPGALGDEAAVTALVHGADAVVHAAVQWEGPRNRGRGSHGEPTVFQGVNLTGSLQLFQAAFEAGVGRFVFVSTCAVHDVILDDRPLDETHPLWPTSPYGAHKAALEAFVHSYGLGQRWPICARTAHRHLWPGSPAYSKPMVRPRRPGAARRAN